MRISLLLLLICLTGHTLGASSTGSSSTPPDTASPSPPGSPSSPNPDAQEMYSMAERFSISTTCNGHDMDALLSEAVTMIENAIRALNALQGSILEADDELKGFIRAAVLVWGVPKPIDGGFALPPDSRRRLARVQDNFQLLLDAIQDTEYMNAYQNYIFCDATNLKWTTKAKEVFPEIDDDMTIEEYLGPHLPDHVSKAGIWVDSEFIIDDTARNWKYHVWFPDQYQGKPMCHEDVAEGVTYRKYPKKMVICPKAWNNYRLDNSQARGDRGTKVWDDWKNMPGVLIHEMLHWLDLQPEEEHIGDENIWHPQKDEEVGAYTLLGVFILAGHLKEEDPRNAWDPDRTVTNADSYNVFATMVYSPFSFWLPYASENFPSM